MDIFYIVFVTVWATLAVEVALLRLFSEKIAEYLASRVAEDFKEKLGEERLATLEKWLQE